MSVVTRERPSGIINMLGGAHMIVPIGVMSFILIMILPMPTWLIDILVTLSITVSMVVLLVSMYILQPVRDRKSVV